jgi:sarcosine oxidase
MSQTRYDAIVIGVGGMGSAASYHLASRGCDVLGLERFDIPHSNGSSHGSSRIIRLAYYEHPSYVPLLHRAYTLWNELEREHDRKLLHRTGSLSVSLPDQEIFQGAKRSCEIHELSHEVLTGSELQTRFPGYEFPSSYRAVFQPDGGFLHAEQCLIAHVQQAHAYGADIRARERVDGWESTVDGVRVTTDRATYEADNLVVTAGPWAAQQLPRLEKILTPERQVLGWFQPTDPDQFTPQKFPVFSCIVEEGQFYGLPIFGRPGFKIGKYHHLNEKVDPDTVAEPTRRDESVLRDCITRYFPSADGPPIGFRSCMFTNTPDDRFVIDTLPDHPEVVVGAGFSGHGFKFSSVIGEVLADLTIHGDSSHDISPFSIDRF